MQFVGRDGHVLKVVEKGTGISCPIEKPSNRKGGYTDGERYHKGRELTTSELGLSLEKLTGQPLELFAQEGLRCC